MASLKPTIDSKSTITIFPEEGLLIPFLEKDPSGNPVDLTGLDLSFHLASGYEKDLVSDPNDPLGRRILLTHAELKANLPSGGSKWAVVDSTGEVPVTLAFGSIVWEDPSWID